MAKKLRKLFLDFSNSSKPINRLMDDIDSEAIQALKDGDTRQKHEAIKSASIVLLSGYLESFMRDVAEAFFSEARNRGIRFKELPVVMHETHFIAGLEEAARIAKNDKKQADPLFQNTRTAIRAISAPPDSDISSLFWRAFAATKGNPGPNVMSDFLKNFGIQSPLAQLAAATTFGEGYLRTTLETFIKLRNECAHTGSVKNTPLPSTMRDYVHFLRVLTLGITKILDKKLVEIDTSAKASRI